jgi:hypothetical protein
MKEISIDNCSFEQAQQGAISILIWMDFIEIAIWVVPEIELK